MKKFAVIRNTGLAKNCEALLQLENLSRKYDISVRTLEDGELPSPDTDIVLVLGGDGTMLRAAKAILDTGIPLLGINLGTLGYLAEVPKEEIDQALDNLAHGNYYIENRMLLHGTVIKNGKVFAKGHALNDIVVSRTGLLRAYSLPLYVNGSLLNTFTADGIIASTATGSTGYSLSAGGPVVSPSAEIILITPLASHSLISRSIILPGTDLYNYVGSSRAAMIWASATKTEYKNLTYGNFHSIGDKCFVCTVSYDADMTANSWYERYSYELKNSYELVFVKKNDVWYAAKMSVLSGE